MHGQRKQKSFERSERLFFEIGHNSYQIQRYLAFLRNFKNYDISRPIFVPIFHNLQTSAFFQAFFVSLEDKFSSLYPFFLSVYRQVQWPSIWVCIAFWFIYQNIRSLSTFWIDYATCLNGLVSSIFLRPISVGSVSIHWCSRYSMYPDSLTTQMYSSSMIYGSLNRSYPRFIHIRVECTLLQ